MPTGPWRTPTAARADELLGLDVVDVDLANREGQIIGKGGDAQRIFWDSEAGRLLARLIGGRTLHKIRHSRLTHLAEAGEDMTMIKAKGRHGSLRSLERYVNPSDRSVASSPHATTRTAGGRTGPMGMTWIRWPRSYSTAHLLDASTPRRRP